jgi:hypothetical protein
METGYQKRKVRDLKTSLRTFRLRLERTAESTGNNMLYVSPEDYHRLVDARLINVDGRLLRAKQICVRMSSQVPIGAIHTGNVTLN